MTPWIFQDDLLRYETEEPFVQTLVMNLEGLLQSFKGSLTTSNYDALIGLLTAEITARLEKVVLKSTFNRVCIIFIHLIVFYCNVSFQLRRQEASYSIKK